MTKLYNNPTVMPLEFDPEELPEMYCPGFRIFIDPDLPISQEMISWVSAEISEFRRQRVLDVYSGEAPTPTKQRKNKPRKKR